MKQDYEGNYQKWKDHCHTMYLMKHGKLWDSKQWDLVGYIPSENWIRWTPSMEHRLRFPSPALFHTGTIYREGNRYISICCSNSDEIEYCTRTQIEELKDGVFNGKVILFMPCSLENPEISLFDRIVRGFK
jgi:hypothetical protein